MLNALLGAAYVALLILVIALIGERIALFIERVFAFLSDLKRTRDELSREQSEWLGGAGGGELIPHDGAMQ